MKPGTLRLATPDEIERIKDYSDLTSVTSVIAYARKDEPSDLAVLRLAPELDPVIFTPETPPQQKRDFIRLVEAHMRCSGGREYYFNASPEDKEWLSVITGWGAQQVSKAPELRFKMYL